MAFMRSAPVSLRSYRFKRPMHIKVPSGSRHALKNAELEMLSRAPWRVVLAPLAVQQLEAGPERLTKAGRVVALDRQATAFLGAIQCEGGDDGVAADRQGLPEAGDIGRAVACLGEKVERRPVVPDIIPPGRLPIRGIGNQPVRLVGAFAETGL